MRQRFARCLRVGRGSFEFVLSQTLSGFFEIRDLFLLFLTITVLVAKGG